MAQQRKIKGDGSVRKRSDGRWEARCTINGQRRSFYGKKHTEVVKAMREAQKVAEELAVVVVASAKWTLEEWLTIWLGEYVQPSCKPLTYSTYKSRTDTHILPALGHIPLRSVAAPQIQAFYNDLLRTKGLHPKTIKNVHGILHKALAQAVKLRYISWNPAEACSLPRAERTEIKPLSESEITAFLAAIRSGEPLRDLFTVALFTGMREGEICGLPWSGVNFADGTITVKQQLCKEKQKGGAHYIAPTKNDRTRTLTLAPFVMEILERLRGEQAAREEALGEAWENVHDLVFTNERGGYIVPQTALKRLKAITTQIGRPDARFHDLRHTYAVTALQEGDDIKTVQQNLGHATASFTLDVYGHVSEKMKRESAARMQAYFDQFDKGSDKGSNENRTKKEKA
ncbi:MAG: site-specific integrase [Clostridia bacterium]|nr:site-specific integrase [Clostridia bacterium]